MWGKFILTPGSAMFLIRGWKSFRRSRGISPEHLLYFQFDGSAILSMKFFRRTGFRLEFCAKSSIGSDTDTSSDSDDENSVFGVKLEGDDSE
ncbi:hypothetical protein D1007_16314 [Hordeum vulgare]|nr:hypothetical protein D1007_16314 [Hordeum vulgare]